jgi:RHS repeat-associated protein
MSGLITELTRYYFAGASRIAMRKYILPQTNTLTYLLADHISSTSLTTDSSGVRTSELRYKAFGETRFSYGTMPTKYTFTGQYSYTDDPSTQGVTEGFGLMYFNARWMDPSLGRFTQPDSIIPDGVQGYDRYAYANNNPIKYMDPNGHDSILSSLWNSYTTGWANYNAATSIIANPNATNGQKAVAGLYAGTWVVAHAALALGVAGLAYAGGAAAVTALTAISEVAATEGGLNLMEGAFTSGQADPLNTINAAAPELNLSGYPITAMEGPAGTEAGLLTDGTSQTISLHSSFFDMSLEQQIYVLQEEILHAAQNITTIAPGVIQAAEEEVDEILGEMP